MRFLNTWTYRLLNHIHYSWQRSGIYKNSIKLLHTGEIIENNELLVKPEYRQDHGKLNSWERYNQSKLEWGDRSADGDWSEPDPYDRRNGHYQSPFRTYGKGSTADDRDRHHAHWVERPHYSNWSYYPNEGKGEKSEDTPRRQADSTSENSTAEHAAAQEQPQEQGSRGTHGATADNTASTEAPQPKPMPRMSKVVSTASGSAIVPADLPDDDEVDAEIEAAKQASIQQWKLSLKPHMQRIDDIQDTDSPTT
eukprot:2139772-Amphidinium_carterae.1